MAEEPNVPLSAIRGLGPLDEARIMACGIQTANQLANTRIAEFKQRCPQLHRKAGSFIKGARTAVRRACKPAEATLPSTPYSTTDEALTAASPLPDIEQMSEPDHLLVDADNIGKKKNKSGKKAKKKAHREENTEKKEKKDRKKPKKKPGKEKNELTARPDKKRSDQKKPDKKKGEKKRNKEKT